MPLADTYSPTMFTGSSTSTATTDSVIWSHWVGQPITHTTTNAMIGQAQSLYGPTATVTWSASTGGTYTIDNGTVVWNNWNSGATTAGWDQEIRVARDQGIHRFRFLETEEEAEARAARLAREREERVAWERGRAERKAVYEAACTKAEKLLFDHLTEEEKTDLANEGHFHVLGSRGGLFRIQRGWAGNVKLLDIHTKEQIATLCVHPRGCGEGGIPDPDVMLAQKLMIMTNEDHFLDLANVHWMRPEKREAFYALRDNARSRLRLVNEADRAAA